MLLVFGAVMVPFIIAFVKYDIFMVRLQAYAFKKIILYKKCSSEASILIFLLYCWIISAIFFSSHQKAPDIQVKLGSLLTNDDAMRLVYTCISLILFYTKTRGVLFYKFRVNVL